MQGGYFQRPKQSKRYVRPMLHPHVKGYSLFGVTVVGLLMLLMVMIMLFRGQSEQVVLRGQHLKQQSLMLAEAAAVTYQSFLARYPDVASYSQNTWGDFATKIADNCTLALSLEAKDLQHINRVAQQGTSWLPINPNDISQGQVRLVDYQYTPDAGVPVHQAPGTGLLRVEGLAKGKGITNEGWGAARSQVELRFRVEAKRDEEAAIGLVGNRFSISTTAGTPKVSSNVCDTSGIQSAAILNPYLGQLGSGEMSKIGYSTNYVTQLPAEGVEPFFGGEVYDLGDLNLPKESTCMLPMLTTSSHSSFCDTALNTFFHESSSNDETDNTEEPSHPVYKYNLNQLTVRDARLILGRTGKEVIHLYVAGNTLIENGGLTVTPGTQVYFYLHGSLKVFNPNTEAGLIDNSQAPENLQIYVYENGDSIQIEETSLTPPNAFIFAPNSDLSLNSATVKGGVWAKNINISGNTSITQNLSEPGLLKVTIPGRNRINPPTSWQQREVS